MDIFETDDELLVRADMPGLNTGDIDIRFEKGELIIQGSVQERQPAGASFIAREYGVGDYHRVFRVTEAIDSDRISASYDLGVLTLHLPKSEAAKPRRIKVDTR